MAAPENLKLIVEAALLAAGRPLSLDALMALFSEENLPERKELRAALDTLAVDYQGRGIEVREVSSGWRIQVNRDMAPWVSRLWDEKPGRYSRATMETLALIAYRQPITRGEIEDIRGVSVNTNTIKTLLEREWIRVVGHRDVPGRPSLYGTTREFLDYFNLRSLDELPTLAEIRDLDEINRELNLDDPDRPPADAPVEDATDPTAETDSGESDRAEGVGAMAADQAISVVATSADSDAAPAPPRVDDTTETTAPAAEPEPDAAGDEAIMEPGDNAEAAPESDPQPGRESPRD